MRHNILRILPILCCTVHLHTGQRESFQFSHAPSNPCRHFSSLLLPALPCFATLISPFFLLITRLIACERLRASLAIAKGRETTALFPFGAPRDTCDRITWKVHDVPIAKIHARNSERRVLLFLFQRGEQSCPNRNPVERFPVRGARVAN